MVDGAAGEVRELLSLSLLLDGSLLKFPPAVVLTGLSSDGDNESAAAGDG